MAAMALHLTKVAVGCASLDMLRARTLARTSDGIAEITTRYRPTRHAELVGGALYWIVKHRIVARQTLLGFVEMEAEKRWIIRLDADLVPVRARPRRAHQGWRYLDAANAPADSDGCGDLGALPARMLEELSALALV